VITPEQSQHVFQLVTGPARGGQNLADKLQRLCLEQPRVAVQIERLVDVFLATEGGA
jgi:hypothetical protein